MACRPASYSTLSLAEKELLCKKATAEPSWTLAQLMQWGTQQFKTPVKRSTLQGILKRKREYSDISEPLLSRKRRCTPHQRALDDRLLRKIEAYKSWHANATVSGALVIAIANREGIQLPSGGGPSRGWLYRFQQRTGLWFSLRHGEAVSLDQEIVEEGVKTL
jgi:hypothetical protein